jgi:hypothetical protein
MQQFYSTGGVLASFLATIPIAYPLQLVVPGEKEPQRIYSYSMLLEDLMTLRFFEIKRVFRAAFAALLQRYGQVDGADIAAGRNAHGILDDDLEGAHHI